MGPALLLAHEVDFAYRSAAVKADWARSRRVARRPGEGTPGRWSLGTLRRRTVRLLHV